MPENNKCCECKKETPGLAWFCGHCAQPVCDDCLVQVDGIVYCPQCAPEEDEQ